MTGGAGDGEVVSAELYDPAKGVFEQVGSMGVGNAPEVASTSRFDSPTVASCVVGSTGGDQGRGLAIHPIALLYDPSTRSFTPTTHTPDPLLGFSGRTATLLPDGRVRLDGGAATNESVWFDPTTGSFTGTTTNDIGYPVSDYQTVAVRLTDGRLLAIGTGPDLHTYATIFDPSNGSVTGLVPPPLISGPQPEATLLPDGRVLLLGAGSAIFDPVTGRFTAIDATVDHFATWTADGRALLTGTPRDIFQPTKPTGLWTFDPATGTVSALDGTLPDTCCTAWVDLSDGRVLGVGGMEGGHPSGTALIVR